MVTVWDITTRRVKSHARGSVEDVKTIDFSPDGSLLATAGRNEVRIWDAATGNCLLNGGFGNFTSAVTFSPDGRRLAVGCPPMSGSPGLVTVLDLDESRGLRTLRGLQQRIVKVVISGDGRRVAALGNDWELGVFDPAPGRKSGPGEVFGGLLGVADAPEAFFTDNAALALSGDGSRLVCSAGTRAKLWDVSKRRLLGEWALPPALTEAAGFRPDGRLILVRQETRDQKRPPDNRAHPKDHPRACRAYELREQDKPRLLTEITDFDWYVEHIAATPDAAYFAVTGLGTKSGKISRILQIYDGSTWARVGSIPTNMPANDAMTGMRFDPKGSRLLVTVEPGRRDVFEIPSLNRTGSMTLAQRVNTGASRWVFGEPHSADTPEMVVLNEQGRDAPLLRIVRDLDVTGGDGIQFSPDGNYLVWGNVDGTVTVCDLNEVQRRLADVGLGWP